mgnify:CR=1 FL=1
MRVAFVRYLACWRFHVEHRAQDLYADRRDVGRHLEKRTDADGCFFFQELYKDHLFLCQYYSSKGHCKGHSVDNLSFTRGIWKEGSGRSRKSQDEFPLFLYSS